MSKYKRPVFHRWLAAMLLSGVTALVHGQIPEQAPTPEAPGVFVVTSWQSFQASPLRNLHTELRTDAAGNPLALLELTETERLSLARYVHDQEFRCGGFFAFDSRADAEHFLLNHPADARATSIANYTIDNGVTVTPWLGEVDETGIRAVIAHLSGYQNRYYRSHHGVDAAEWIRDTWLALGNGRPDVSVELFHCSLCDVQPSVILTVEGADIPDEVVVIGAHLDSINQSSTPSNLEQDAPGADDDASGIATITETIRIALADGWRPKRTVKFMAYAAEEVGLIGSRAIASAHAEENIDVIGVLQLDMTNYHLDVPYHLHLISDHVDPLLQLFAKDLFDTYLAPLGLARRDLECGYACSDHASWTNYGYPAVMASEPGSISYDFFPWLHTPYDTLENMGNTAEPSTVFARFSLAFLAEMAKTSNTPDERIFRDGFEAGDNRTRK